MSTITRTAARLVIATGFAAAVTLSGSAAFAEAPNGPGQFGVTPHVDPEGPQIANPTPAPDPLPVPPQPKDPNPGPDNPGPGEIADEPSCTHGCGDPEPENPGGVITAPGDNDDPTDEPGDEPDQGCFTGCDLPEEPAGPTTDEGFTTPTRVDAGQDSAAPAPFATADADSDESGLSYYVGLGLFSLAGAAGVALAARRLIERNRKTAQV